MQVQHGADQGIENYTSSKKRLRSWKNHSVENRRSWTTSMQWRANVQNGFTTGIQTCLWLRWWETKRTKQTMVVCFWNESSHFTSMYHQEILGWGAYLPLPGFDKKGRMVLMCQMEVLCTKSSDDHQKFFPAEDQPCKDQFQPPDVGLSDDHLHSS